MAPYLEWILVVWTLLAAAWWTIAIVVTWRQQRRSRSGAVTLSAAFSSESPTVTIFKPIASLGTEEPPASLVAALESFIVQLDSRSEMLLGIQRDEAEPWEPVLERWRGKFPVARVKSVVRAKPNFFLSPKVSWLHALAEHATGEWWMWSDSDIVAPAGMLTALRREMIESGDGMLTCPYAIRGIETLPMMLEALFVNVEFYPGVLACRAAGPVRFGLGAGMVFSAERFRQRVQWEALGARMADDNALGRALAPVRISHTVLETEAAETNWRDAVQHYLRWQKTIRWCQPAGFAGQILIVPMLGWLLAVLTHPGTAVAWLGLVVTAQLELMTAAIVFWLVGCELKSWRVVGLWSVLLRPLTWVY